MAVKQRRKITKGPNKGDTIVAQAATQADMDAGNWYPVRVLKDVGNQSTLRDNSGVAFGKGGNFKERVKMMSNLMKKGERRKPKR